MELPQINLQAVTSLTGAKEIITTLLNSMEGLLKIITKQTTEIESLKKEVARLKSQPKRPDFSTKNQKEQKGKSMSVTGLLKEKILWKKNRKKGKVPIDREVNMEEVEQCECGCNEFITLRTHTKVVQGLEIKRDNVAYKGRVKECKRCGKKYKSRMPKALQGRSFSLEFSTFLSFWKYCCRVTQPLLIRTVRGLGVIISSGQLNNLLIENGKKLKEADQHLRTVGIRKSKYLQSDASGTKRRDKRSGKIIKEYIQVISNKLFSIFTITKHYNAKTLNRILTKAGREKKFVSDDGSPNGESLFVKIKQLCWVHEIRHYQKLFPFFNSHQDLQKRILKQWQTFYHLAKQYGTSPPEERGKRRKKIEKLFIKITSQTTGYDLLDNQLKLTKKKRARLLIFLDHPELPIHNNQCESDIRPFVIIRNISGATKSYQGDKSLARHLSIIHTAQKQGLDVYATLHGLLTGSLTPAVLTANIC